MKTKTYHCVIMKNAIQAKHRRQRAGLSDETVRQLITRRLADSDDPLARKWHRLHLEKGEIVHDMEETNPASAHSG